MDEELVEKNLIREIKELELQNTAANRKLQRLENEIKVETQKKMFFEANIDETKKNIEYYTNSAAKLRNRLKKTKHVHSQFTMAAQCYEKLLSDYSETYLHYETEGETNRHVSIPESTEVLQEQIKYFQKKVDDNAKLIETMMNSLEVPSTEEDSPMAENDKPKTN